MDTNKREGLGFKSDLYSRPVLPPATCHLPPATCHLPPATCHLPPATYHLLATNYFPKTTSP